MKRGDTVAIKTREEMKKMVKRIKADKKKIRLEKKELKHAKKLRFEKRRFAPLKASFMFTSMVGFVVSVLLVRKWDPNWAFAFAALFVLMFIASLISISHSAPDSELAPRVKKEL